MRLVSLCCLRQKVLFKFRTVKCMTKILINFIFWTGADTTSPGAGGPLPKPDGLFTPPGGERSHQQSPLFANYVSNKIVIKYENVSHGLFICNFN